MNQCDTCIKRDVCRIAIYSDIFMTNCQHYYCVENINPNASTFPLLYSMTTGDNYIGREGEQNG